MIDLVNAIPEELPADSHKRHVKSSCLLRLSLQLLEVNIDFYIYATVNENGPPSYTKPVYVRYQCYYYANFNLSTVTCIFSIV
jgi:hypothetical protein